MTNSSNAQAKMNALIDSLPPCINKGQTEIIRFLGEYIALNDSLAIESRFTYVAQQLKEAGYTTETSSEERITIQKHGLEAFGKRLIEFSLYFLETGRPVPAGAHRYAASYLEHLK